MDPVSIISIAGTAFSVVERVTKLVNFFLKLSTRFKATDAKVTSLIGYLASLNASITEIARIVEGLSEHGQYSGLAGSLNTTLQCTTFSMSFLETMISGLGLERQDELNTLEKINVLLKSEEFDGYLTGINTYVNALNLHLNALQTRSLLEQKGILSSSDAQVIMDAMKDETSSLFCIADNRSMMSHQTKDTEFSAALDVSFEFDTEILSSRIYAATYRSHLRQAITAAKNRPNLDDIVAKAGQTLGTLSGLEGDPFIGSVQQASEVATKLDDLSTGHDLGYEDHTPSSQQSGNSSTSLLVTRKNLPAAPSWTKQFREDGVARLQNWSKRVRGNSKTSRSELKWYVERNAEVERFLKRERLETANEMKCIFLGTSESGKSTLLKAVKLFEEGPYSRTERELFKETIFSNLVQSTRVILEAMETLEIPLDDVGLQQHVHQIFIQPAQMEVGCLPPKVGDAIGWLRHDKGFQACLARRREYQLADCVDFYFESIMRIAEPDYLPTDEDIARSRIKTTGITEKTFRISDNSDTRIWRTFDVGGTRSERKKWIHCFENVSMVVFTVDIGAYDQALFEDETANHMHEALMLFESICNLKWFTKTEILLCFTKQSKLASKIHDSPIQEYFPDCEGLDVDGVTDYFINRFKSLNHNASKTIYTIVLKDLLQKEEWDAIKSLGSQAFRDKFVLVKSG